MNYEIGAIAEYHDQPPIDTTARVWKQARTIDENTTIKQLIEWADSDGLAYLTKLEITLRYIKDY